MTESPPPTPVPTPDPTASPVLGPMRRSRQLPTGRLLVASVLLIILSFSFGLTMALWYFTPTIPHLKLPTATAVRHAALQVSPALYDVTAVLPKGEAALGTGMLIDGDKLVTNNHVIAGSLAISVRNVYTGQVYVARLMGYDAQADVALLLVDTHHPLPTIRTSTAPLAHGTQVVVVGNAGGHNRDPIAAPGAVVSTNQSVIVEDNTPHSQKRLSGVIHVESLLQPGDSGGALTNLSGVVVGMTTAGSTADSADPTVGYAIPIGTALGVAHQIEAGKPSQTVQIVPLDNT